MMVRAQVRGACNQKLGDLLLNPAESSKNGKQAPPKITPNDHLPDRPRSPSASSLSCAAAGQYALWPATRSNPQRVPITTDGRDQIPDQLELLLLLASSRMNLDTAVLFCSIPSAKVSTETQLKLILPVCRADLPLDR